MARKRNIIESEYVMRYDDQDYNIFWSTIRLERYYKRRYETLKEMRRRHKRRYRDIK